MTNAQTQKKSSLTIFFMLSTAFMMLLILFVSIYSTVINNNTMAEDSITDNNSNHMGDSFSLLSYRMHDPNVMDNNNSDTSTVMPTKNVNYITLDIRGSNSIGTELMPKLLEGYYASIDSHKRIEKVTGFDERRLLFSDGHKHFGIDICSCSHGSEAGVKALAIGETQLAMSSRRIKPQEMAFIKNNSVGNNEGAVQEIVIAVDGVTIIVHPSNPINELSFDKLRKVFSGEITNWKALGGDNQAIHLYVRDDNSDTKKFFEELVMDGTETAYTQKFKNSNLLSKTVSTDKGAIGYVGLPYSQDAKVLAVSDGVSAYSKPDLSTLSAQTYPLTRSLYLYLPINATPDAKAVADFAVSNEGQKIVEQTGYVSRYR